MHASSTLTFVALLSGVLAQPVSFTKRGGSAKECILNPSTCDLSGVDVKRAIYEVRDATTDCILNPITCDLFPNDKRDFDPEEKRHHGDNDKRHHGGNDKRHHGGNDKRHHDPDEADSDLQARESAKECILNPSTCDFSGVDVKRAVYEARESAKECILNPITCDFSGVDVKRDDDPSSQEDPSSQNGGNGQGSGGIVA